MTSNSRGIAFDLELVQLLVVTFSCQVVPHYHSIHHGQYLSLVCLTTVIRVSLSRILTGQKQRAIAVVSKPSRYCGANGTLGVLVEETTIAFIGNDEL